MIKKVLKGKLIAIILVILVSLFSSWLYDRITEQPKKERLIVSPMQFEYECNSFNIQLPFRVINNYDFPLYQISVLMNISNINIIEDFELEPKFEPNYVNVGGYGVDTKYHGFAAKYDNKADQYFLQIYDIDAHGTMEFEIKIDSSKCNGKIRFNIIKVSYSGDVEFIYTQ